MTQTAGSCAENANSYHHGNLRQALLDAAVVAIRESGPENLSLRAIARRVGVSQTAPYRHFADKNDLLAELARQAFDDINDVITQYTESGNTASERLEQAAIAYLHYAIINPEKYRLVFGNHVQNRFDYSNLVTSGRRCFESFLTLMNTGIKNGEFIDSEPMTLSNTIWSAIHGFAFLCIDGTFDRLEQPLSQDQMIAAQAAMMVRSIARHPAT